MNKKIISIKRSTADNAYIILLLPAVMLSTSIKNALAISLLTGVFFALSYLISLIVGKYLSKAIVYPTILTVLAALVILAKFVPAFWGIRVGFSATAALFFTLFLLKYITGKKRIVSVKGILKKYLSVAVCMIALGAACEFLSFGSLLGFKIHNHPVTFFCSTTGIFIILSIFAIMINLVLANIININRTFRFGHGSVKLIAYSSAVALVLIVSTRVINDLLLNRFNASYLTVLVMCFICSIVSILIKLADKKLQIGRTATNLIPSVALLIAISIYNSYSSYKNILFRFAVYSLIFAASAFFCTYSNKKNNSKNPLVGAPATLMFFAVASLMIDYLRMLI